MSDLASWLLEQIAADEEGIRSRTFDRPIHFVGCYYYSYTLDAGLHCDCNEDDDATGFFLAECDAKRRIVQAWQEGWPGGMGDGLWYAMALVARPYADRPGYLEEWKP